MKTQKEDESPEKTQEGKLKEEAPKTCFIIMPISDVGGYDIGHFKRVYEYIIKPACKQAGFEPMRADDPTSSSVIIIDILQKILSADMAICDFSSKNPNVMYELGIRQAFDMPVTLIKDEKTDRVFDTQVFRDITYQSQLRIDQVEQAVLSLTNSITETYENKGNEVNSIVGLLGRTKAQVKHNEISPEFQLVLDSISALSRSMIPPAYPTYRSISDSEPVLLANGDVVYLGETLFYPPNGLGTLIDISLKTRINSRQSSIIDTQLTIKFEDGYIRSLWVSSSLHLTKYELPS